MKLLIVLEGCAISSWCTLFFLAFSCPLWGTATAGDIEKLKVKGLFVNGHYNIVTAVNLIQPVKNPSTGINNALVAPAAKNAPVYNLAGQQVGASYKGVVIKNGKKYVQK